MVVPGWAKCRTEARRRKPYHSTGGSHTTVRNMYVRTHTTAHKRSYCWRRACTTTLGVCWVGGFVQCFYIGLNSPSWWIYMLLVKVPYLHNINYISNYYTGFAIFGFIRGFPYPKYCVYILCDVVDVSQYLLSTAILVKEIHVWFPVTN